MSLWRGCGACSEQRRAAARSLGVPARQAPPTVPARQQACSVPRSQHPADGAHLGAARRRPSASPAICAPPPVDRGGRNQARWRQRVAPVKLTTRLLSDHSRVSSASPAECAPPPVDSNRQTGSTRHRQCGWFACCPCRPLCHSDHHSLCRPTHPPTHPTCLGSVRLMQLMEMSAGGGSSGGAAACAAAASAAAAAISPPAAAMAASAGLPPRQHCRTTSWAVRDLPGEG